MNKINKNKLIPLLKIPHRRQTDRRTDLRRHIKATVSNVRLIKLSEHTSTYKCSTVTQNILHSSNEPSERSQWLCHDDSIINIVLDIILLLLLLL